MDKKDIFNKLYFLLNKLQSENNYTLRIKYISEISHNLNELKSFQLESYEKKDMIMIVNLLDKEKRKLNKLDKLHQDIFYLFTIDDTIKEIIDDLKKKDIITHKEFLDFLKKVNDKGLKK